MTWVKLIGVGTSLVVATALLGCQQPQISMEEMMKPPPRPAELDKLEMFIGQWQGTAEGKMLGSPEVFKTSGTGTITWEADKWVLVERGEYTMGDQGKMAMIGFWTWDPQAKKYRLWWFDDHGGSSSGTATYDAATKTWHMKGKNRYVTGETTVSEGTTKVLDNNTMEWSFTEWDSWKCRKFIELKGTSRRK